MENNIVVLDATLRDGGLVNNHYFSDDFVKKLYKMNVASGTNYMEFGYRASKKKYSSKEYGKWKFSTDKDIRKIVGNNKTNLKISIMVDVGRCDYENDIQEKDESPVDLVRVATYIHQIPEAIKMIEYADKKGYETSCNIMATSKCSEKQLEKALDALANTPIRVAYIVDSYGALYPSNIKEYTQLYCNKLLQAGIATGIHAHNNQQCAFANTIEGISNGATWIDATIYGMGRGAGNCYLESLIAYLRNEKYLLEPMLDFIQKEMIPLKQSGVRWGYNTYYLLTGIANKHPRTAIEATQKGNIDLLKFEVE